MYVHIHGGQEVGALGLPSRVDPRLQSESWRFGDKRAAGCRQAIAVDPLNTFTNTKITGKERINIELTV